MASSNIFTFGQFKGLLIDEVLLQQPWYVKWAYEAIEHDEPHTVAHGGVSEEQYARALKLQADRRNQVMAERKARREAKAMAKANVKVQKAKVHRFGAYLRRYGPRGGLPTHFKLVLPREPRPNTPEAFHLELEAERDMDYRAAQHGFGLFWELRLARAEY